MAELASAMRQMQQLHAHEAPNDDDDTGGGGAARRGGGRAAAYAAPKKASATFGALALDEVMATSVTMLG